MLDPSSSNIELPAIPVITSYSIHYTKLYEEKTLLVGELDSMTGVKGREVFLGKANLAVNRSVALYNRLLVITSYSIHYTKLYDKIFSSTARASFRYLFPRNALRAASRTLRASPAWSFSR